ncbi:uncharacterized protein CLUP02_05293 [Colletotrichum lupini]|uniref:Uncharacterized protein n=1 Tax=Colletotrichum lupini TaxID=145971 RepID=A0A9Q8SM84_9PEZI|nr:uncharacterized protein CLUP02_05293 [Colletotrichum lupini]KAK1705546.1 hypothetical protein BDP67DRAFT_191027 [Colletotrichum lupini]UQC79813.1 hypothetical protein CLUP02_05293 [Colletotrichum lupini]
MDVTESSEPTPSFSHLLGLLLEAITAYLLVRAPFLPELSCPSTHQRRRPLSPNYIRMIINLLLTSLSRPGFFFFLCMRICDDFTRNLLFLCFRILEK